MPMRVLTVDDDDFTLKTLQLTLERMGYVAVPARDGAEALKLLHEQEIRLVITDWEMPGMDGLEVCRRIRREDHASYAYIIMLTGREGAKQRVQGLCAGADDFLNKPLDPEELLVSLKTAERILSLETRDVTLFAMAKLAESRDTDTGLHVERVQSYARVIAQHLSAECKAYHGVDADYIRLLYQTTPLHDLGKVSIPDAVLLKPGKLTPEEFAIMQTHTTVGAQTLDAALSKFPNARFLQMARDIAATHHEWFDGSGYPLGLAGEQIPLCGRIVAVADVYDALTSRRVYKRAATHEHAMSTIVAGRGRQFDPDVVDAFLRAETLILETRERLQDVIADEPPAEALAEPAQPLADPAGILIVEDDAVVRDKLEKMMLATGERVFTAIDGEDALRVMQASWPRVVVSDWVMPHLDGVELCRRIRARKGVAPVHFIMLTIHSDKSRLLEAYEAGVDDFIAKPFNVEELLARVRAGIRAMKLLDELKNNAAGSQALTAQLTAMNSRLERLSVTDELTGLFNRRYATQRLAEHWELAARHGSPLSIAVADIDHFKRVNDTHGHDSGDAILRQVSTLLREQARGTDTVCRLGGEEFLVLFPMQTEQEARAYAERCRGLIQQHVFQIEAGSARVTISFGIAARRAEMADLNDLLRVADQSLYEAKRAGRNRVCVASDCAGASAGAADGPAGCVPDAGMSAPGCAAAVPGSTRDVPATSMTAPASTMNAGSSMIVPDSSMNTLRSITNVDLAALLERCGGDAEFASATLEKFRSGAASLLETLGIALQAGDADGVRRAAHSLKSMAAYVGAESAAALARELETLARSDQLEPAPPVLESLQRETRNVIACIEQTRATEQRP